MMEGCWISVSLNAICLTVHREISTPHYSMFQSVSPLCLLPIALVTQLLLTTNPPNPCIGSAYPIFLRFKTFHTSTHTHILTTSSPKVLLCSDPFIDVIWHHIRQGG